MFVTKTNKKDLLEPPRSEYAFYVNEVTPDMTNIALVAFLVTNICSII